MDDHWVTKANFMTRRSKGRLLVTLVLMDAAVKTQPWTSPLPAETAGLSGGPGGRFKPFDFLAEGPA